MKLKDYFRRIGFNGPAQPTFGTLSALLRCHVLSVAFENVDVQLGIPVSMDVEAAFEKIVGRRRGGWCFEQNGLFGWALSDLGFDVTRVAAAVRRDERGDDALANHLCLLVRTPDDPESTYLADVGFGGSMIRPMPLETASHEQSPFTISLRRLNDGHWQFGEESGANDSVSYDFLAQAAVESTVHEKCAQLQTDPDSSFVLNLVAQKRLPESHLTLRGRVLTTNSLSGKKSTTLQSQEEFADVLRHRFELDTAEAASLWPRIVDRHRLLFGE